ncbi:ABC transporter ATP-binding protein [Telmatocola sphagniphila]|uniref:ABC transporter ATP-binding protein n=1 Tax=Telmatocola sphagniphila TaxID=1123043 RepID=A0A8E6B7D9_9BACT|nr:ABC transporter ATP-binding protein [Telmatocola sphagniphila]QVL33480.1 ABC transporter ATP-binding protein [Telmatocola sphagniphila]
MSSPILSVSCLSKTHGEGESRVQALRSVTMTVEAGEFAVLMGVSGSGKSTLLNLLAGLDRPTSGSIRLYGEEIADLDDDARTILRRQRIGLIFQSFQLLESLTAEENVALPLTIGGMKARDARHRAAETLECVGLAKRRLHRPHQLSGGEQQRVAIARALAIKPAILLADEPTGNLDTKEGERIILLLKDLVEIQGQTLVLVTHDPSHEKYADRIIHLRDGHIVEEMLQPRNNNRILPTAWNRLPIAA